MLDFPHDYNLHMYVSIVTHVWYPTYLAYTHMAIDNDYYIVSY